VATRNEVDARAYSLENLLNSLGQNVPPSDRARIENLVSDARRAIAGEDLKAIERSLDDLQKAATGLARLEEQSRTSQGPAQGRGPDVNEGEVIDAETVETGPKH
jgi:molecular chaperone DnaK